MYISPLNKGRGEEKNKNSLISRFIPSFLSSCSYLSTTNGGGNALPDQRRRVLYNIFYCMKFESETEMVEPLGEKVQNKCNNTMLVISTLPGKFHWHGKYVLLAS